MPLTPPDDLHEVRRNSLLLLFSQYVGQRMQDAPSEQITGLDREFAALIQVHNTYFSGMKSGARTIGERLARQIESLCRQDKGWLDAAHEPDNPVALEKFLRLARTAFLAAPAERRGLAAAMRDAIKQQSK